MDNGIKNEYEVEILESTGGYSNIKLRTTLMGHKPEDMISELISLHGVMRGAFGELAIKGQKATVKATQEAKSEAQDESSDSGIKCPSCGEWRPITTSQKGTKMCKCDPCKKIAFIDKYSEGENWKWSDQKPFKK